MQKKDTVLYPSDFEIKIGFNRIRELLKKHCLSPLGEGWVDQISFRFDYEQIKELLEQVWEFKVILTEGFSFPITAYFDLTQEIRRLRTDGTFIEPEVLFDMRSSLITIIDCVRFFKAKGGERFTTLSSIAGEVKLDPSLIERIDSIIDEKGNIRDGASPMLKKIRADLVSHQHMIDKRIQATLQKAKKDGWIGEDVAITIRSGRAVLPVPVSHKRKIQGFIHDESSSGQTVFIEPTDIFEINNEIRELENAERREIIRILTVFTDHLRPQLDYLDGAYQFLGTIDFIRAKALLAIQINGEKPVIKPHPMMRWQQAIHPLLYLSHEKQNKKVIPLNLELDDQQRILIISGPNAGGKSICLKTAGLLQYMIQCGLLVPVSEYSDMGLFKNLFIDIGDEQSIDNDLSTYSSHLLNIKHIINHSDERTLFLIDEFGSGTEPQLGGAIAEATLEVLHEKKVLGIVTTHYANLKLMAGTLPGIVNGAMLFDQARMQPLYRLKIGNPGSSYALEIAKKIGFPENILDAAAIKTGKTQLDFDQQLQQLELEKESVEKKQTEFKVADEFLAEIILKYQKLLEDLEKNKASIISDAREKARQIINDSNRLIEQTIRDIRQQQAEKEATKKARGKIEGMKEKLTGDTEEQLAVDSWREAGGGRREAGGEKREPGSGKREMEESERAVITDKDQKSKTEDWKPLTSALKKGDTVRIKGQQMPGEVLEIKGNEALIAFGMMKVKVAADRLEILNKTLEELASLKPTRSYSSINSEIHSRMAAFKLTIDLRGKRAEEAVNEVRKYIDEALLLNIPEVTIVHGKGDGILLQVIRDYLRSIPEVKHYADEPIERGGHGVTIVKFR